MPGPDAKLRPVGPAASLPLSRLHAAAFAPLGLKPWPESAFRKLLTLETTAGLGVFEDSHLRAFILGQTTGTDAEILTVATDPAARGQGFARRLLAALLAHYAGAGVRKVFLEVMTGNSPALALYRGAGFNKVGERPNYYQDVRTGNLRSALILAKDLEYLRSGSDLPETEPGLSPSAFVGQSNEQ